VFKLFLVWDAACGADCTGDWAEVFDAAAPDDDVDFTITESRPESAVTREGGHGGEAASEGGAEVVVVRLQRCGEDEILGAAAFHKNAHGAGEGYFRVEEVFEGFLRGFLSHGGNVACFGVLLQVCEEMIEVVCGVIRDGEGRVLACRRSAERHLGGLWEFPGGKVDAGESYEAALVRELMEELAISVEVSGQVGEPVVWSDEKVTIRLTAFFCEISEGQPVAIDHSEIRWCRQEEMERLDWAEADLPILETLRCSF
jgi:8-oxo-dGTP diphosphatase